MKNVVKLDILFNLPENKTRILSKHGFRKNSQVPLFVKKYVSKKNIDYIKSILPKKIIPEIVAINISDILSLGIHAHKFDRSVINFYIKTNNEETIFYKEKKGYSFLDIVNENNDEWIDNNDVYYEIIEQKVYEEEKFIARDNDCWLLDTTIPHAVKLTTSDNTVRTVLQIYLKTSFKESMEILHEICIKE